MIIYFLTIFIRITITFEYNNNNDDDDDDDDEKQAASQLCKFSVFLFDPSFSSYQHCQVRCFQSSVKLSTLLDHDQSINISDRNVFFYVLHHFPTTSYYYYRKRLFSSLNNIIF
jgi:hypothetical protein